MKKIMIVVILGLALVAGFLVGCDALVPQGIMGAGVTNLTNLELAGTLDVAGASDLVGTLNYGADNHYPVGFASSGQQFVFSSSSITGTAVAAHGLTTVTYALCTIGEDPIAGANGHSAICSVTVAANVVTVKAWKDDLVTAATETGLTVYWLVVGTP
jgi:hypothetical protein